MRNGASVDQVLDTLRSTTRELEATGDFVGEQPVPFEIIKEGLRSRADQAIKAISKRIPDEELMEVSSVGQRLMLKVCNLRQTKVYPPKNWMPRIVGNLEIFALVERMDVHVDHTPSLANPQHNQTATDSIYVYGDHHRCLIYGRRGQNVTAITINGKTYQQLWLMKREEALNSFLLLDVDAPIPESAHPELAIVRTQGYGYTKFGHGHLDEIVTIKNMEKLNILNGELAETDCQKMDELLNEVEDQRRAIQGRGIGALDVEMADG
jgi:hypothetical protein